MCGCHLHARCLADHRSCCCRRARQPGGGGEGVHPQAVPAPRHAARGGWAGCLTICGNSWLASNAGTLLAEAPQMRMSSAPLLPLRPYLSQLRRHAMLPSPCPVGVGGGRPSLQGNGAPRGRRRQVQNRAADCDWLHGLACHRAAAIMPTMPLHQTVSFHACLWCRAHRDLRAALAILSMAAASRPEAFSQQHVEDLLRYGCAPR